MKEEIAIKDKEAGGSVTFRLLGAFRMTSAGRPYPPGPWQQQRLLVKLLAAKGMPVTNDELMAAIWDEIPGPGATLDALYHLVGAVRRTLTGADLGDVLGSANGTYWLEIPPAYVDVHVFRVLTERARALAGDDDRRAVRLLEEALRLCHGEPLAGMPGRWVDGYRHTRAEEIRAAELALYEVALSHGESRERLPGLSTLLRERPDDELVAWLYMHALYRAGQPTRALEVKREFAAQLLDTNGTENGRALDDLYRRILANDDDLLTPEAVAFPGGVAGTRARRSAGPDSRDGQEQERGEPGPPAAGRAASTADDPTATRRHEPAAAGVSNVFNGPVNAKRAVFGTQINYGGPR